MHNFIIFAQHTCRTDDKRYAVRRYAVRFGGIKSAGDGLEEVKEKALLNVNIFNTYI